MTATIYTIGYASGVPVVLRDHVLALGATLVDVRIAPTSKSPQWRKEALATLMGTAYHYLPALGNRNAFTGGPVALNDSERALTPGTEGTARSAIAALLAPLRCSAAVPTRSGASAVPPQRFWLNALALRLRTSLHLSARRDQMISCGCLVSIDGAPYSYAVRQEVGELLMQRPISIAQKVRGVLQIFRPELPTAAGVCVLLGQVLALGAVPPLPALGFGFACGFLLSGSALITNDYFDLEVARINAPQRPLPAGILTPPEVLTLGLGTAIFGLAAAAAFGPLAFGVSLIIWLLGLLYNWRLKAAGLWGNLIVAMSVGATFVLGGIIVGQPWNLTVWTFALIALVFDLAEEIAGDAMDAEGDRRRGSRSLALLYGRTTALRISAALFGLVVVLTLLPWGTLDLAYRIPIVLTDLLIIFFVIRLLRSQTPAEGRRAMRGLYLSGTLGLLAFLIGALVAV